MTDPAIISSSIPAPLPAAVAGNRPGLAVCAVCRGAAARGHRTCWSCEVVGGQLGAELCPTVPVSLFAPGSTLHELLVAYKAAPAPRVRRQSRELLSEHLAEFFTLHLGCLVGPLADGSPATLAVPVPSSSRPRTSWHGEHPLVGLLRKAVCSLPDLCLAQLLARGSEPLGHLRASVLGFRVTADVAGQRVLVVDDTYTTGARSQSAAAALTRAGADVKAIVPIGRLIHPDHNLATRALWAQQHRRRFDPERCSAPCRVGPEPADVCQEGAAFLPSWQQQPPELARRSG